MRVYTISQTKEIAPYPRCREASVSRADPADVRLAAEIFGHVLAAEKIEEPDPGSTLTVERAEKSFTPFFVSIEPRSSPQEQGNSMTPLRAALDADARANAYRRAVETATSRIEEARKSGASLYLTDVEAVDMEPVLQHASDLLDRWLEGCRERTNDFRRRVRLAETAFLALCEALLVRDPARGVELWHALRATMATRYVGAAGVDVLLHMVFRAPDSIPVAELRDEVISLPRCHTDRGLFDIAVVASYNGKTAWLSATAEADRASPFVWRQKRAALLAGFTAGNTLPVADAWPEGEIRTGHADLHRKTGGFRWSEACAHHWWRAYLDARDTVEAYAAWVLFLRSADRRARVWMREDVEARNSSGSVLELKLAHVQLNRAELKQAMEKRLDKADEKFLDDDIVNGIGPWAA
jgi:hypothetical protein